MEKQPPFEPGGIYHVFNHANGKENMFDDPDNYRYFLEKYAEKLGDVVTTLAYCLMPNHFHLLVQVNSMENLKAFLKRKKEKQGKLKIPPWDSEMELAHFIVKRQFHNFLGGYSKAFNKFHGRAGSLLRQNTCRKMILEENYLMNAIRYIHLNSVFHDFTVLPEEWAHHSYHAYLSDKPTRIPREEILGWFGGREGFIQFHREKLDEGLRPDWEK